MTNGQLFKYHQDIQSLGGSILEIFLRSKIKEFYNSNGVRLRTLTEKMQALSTEYFQYKENKPVYGEDKKPLLNEGKTEEEYREKFKELMEREINIIL